ncbi:MAG: hypothetical protein ACOYNZ_13420 [Rhodoferax sp.]
MKRKIYIGTSVFSYLTPRCVELAKGLVAAGIVPAKASEDARHIANPEIQAGIAAHFQQ